MKERGNRDRSRSDYDSAQQWKRGRYKLLSAGPGSGMIHNSDMLII